MESSLVVEVSAGVDERFLGALSRLYEVSFRSARGRTAFGEGADASHFINLVRDPSVRCFIALDSAKEPIGFAALTREIERIGWVERGFYEARYPQAFAEGRFYYIPYVFVHPKAQAFGLVAYLFDKLIAVLTAERAIVGFDVSLANLELVTLFRTALARANGTGGPALVDTHSFFVAPLDGSPAELLNRTPESVEPR